MQHYVCGFDLVSTAAPVLSSGFWGNCMLLATMKEISKFILSFLTVIEYTRDQNILYVSGFDLVSTAAPALSNGFWGRGAFTNYVYKTM